MSTKHTPGPWALHPIHCGVAYVVPEAHTEHAVGGHTNKAEDLRVYAQEICALVKEHRHRTATEQVANARLIAAAPELLTWLSWALHWLDAEVTKKTWQYEQARAAIAKATGEQA